MNLLLDTHIALWAITDSPRLSSKARKMILSSEAEIFVSAASIWEIAIKRAIKPESMPVTSQDAARYFNDAGYQILNISAEHAIAVEALPALHRDPFDRMLVAQAQTEPMHLLTHDATVAQYGDVVVLC